MKDLIVNLPAIISALATLLGVLIVKRHRDSKRPPPKDNDE